MLESYRFSISFYIDSWDDKSGSSLVLPPLCMEIRLLSDLLLDSRELRRKWILY
uniref:Uncharacterized protein n=1 Tax=Rhizophagus irregularis (strain DAOM 181602 / DAOM 197198 / MUCL 43194) TaxID=747089 RepID=U9SXR1_RHIID